MTKPLRALDVHKLLTEIIEKAKGRRERLTFEVVINQPGGLGGTPAVDFVTMSLGFDWDAGRILLQPEKPLTLLAAEDVAAIRESVRKGQSWHAYQAHQRHEAEKEALRDEIAVLRARLAVEVQPDANPGDEAAVKALNARRQPVTAPSSELPVAKVHPPRRRVTALEGKSTTAPHRAGPLLISRRGQLVSVDLFDASTNYNSVVIAQSGAGVEPQGDYPCELRFDAAGLGPIKLIIGQPRAQQVGGAEGQMTARVEVHCMGRVWAADIPARPDRSIERHLSEQHSSVVAGWLLAGRPSPTSDSGADIQRVVKAIQRHCQVAYDGSKGNK